MLFVTPFQSMMMDSRLLYGLLAVRALLLLVLLAAVHRDRVAPITGGRLFLLIGLSDMVASAFVFDSEPNGVLVEAVAHGTIFSIVTLLIAPSRTRRKWSLVVIGIIFGAAATRLVPGDELLLVQLMAILVVHTTAVLALDVHANRAEVAGAMATVDPLTGLVNRRPAIERMTEELTAVADLSVPSSVVMLDIDHFKRVNDTLGHEAGDDALRHASGAMSALVRGRDTLCRWGGEEFLVLLPGATSETAAQVAERMRAEIERLGVTASFGVAQAVERDTVTEWVHRADDAMYRAKRNGRNQVVVNDRSASASRSTKS
ncbi:MAG: GGDEF domain-containing protein [Ilumatobacter sp.]|uniref:GGDEF domain-containing protein n=1 Tax=Ilumatobacter sp. TaxID=1967498 RepID=UPI00329A6DBA